MQDDLTTLADAGIHRQNGQIIGQAIHLHINLLFADATRQDHLRRV